MAGVAPFIGVQPLKYIQIPNQVHRTPFPWSWNQNGVRTSFPQNQNGQGSFSMSFFFFRQGGSRILEHVPHADSHWKNVISDRNVPWTARWREVASELERVS